MTITERTSELPTDDRSPDAPVDDTASADLLAQRLTETQVEEIATLLRAGRRLPPHLFPHLFETPREYQLAYQGKARAIDILAETMAVPLQPVRTFGEHAADSWSNMLVFGDNLQVLRQLVLKSFWRLRRLLAPLVGSRGTRRYPVATEHVEDGAVGDAEVFADRRQ